MSRYLSLTDYDKLSDKFKYKYQKWWRENIQVGDKTITKETFKLVKKSNYSNTIFSVDGDIARLQGSDIYQQVKDLIGLPNIETLVEFIKSEGYYIVVEDNEVSLHEVEDGLYTGIQREGINLLDAILSVAERICEEAEYENKN